jgi:ketosteroid isomerase-like protein
MSQENVEVVKGAVDAFNAHELDRYLSFLAPEFEYVDHMGAVAEVEGSGIDAIRRQVEGWFDAFPDFRASVGEFIDAGDRVVSVTTWQGTGAGSGLPYDQEAAEVLTVRDGKIIRAELGFVDRAAALEAAGLSE